MKYFNAIRRHICNPASVVKTVIVAAVLVCGVWGCNDPEEQKREIVLSAPDNGATFDLAAVDNINFSWTKVDGVTGYTLKFAMSEAALAETKATVDAVSASELKLQMGDPSGSEYYEIEYQRTPYTVPAMPTETSISRYTGSTAPFIGTWKQTKVEDAFQYTGGNLQWYIENYTNGSVLQVNDDNTWTSTGGTNSVGGTWSFNPTNGEISLNVITPSGEVSMVYIIEASSNASTLVYAEFNSDIDGKGFTRTTLAKQ